MNMMNMMPGGGGPRGGKAMGKGGKGPDWICSQCGNSNFGDRTHCNMRKCGAAREVPDWVCSSCGNRNFADRTVCNMRNCGAERDDIDLAVVEELIAMKRASKGQGR